MKHMYLITEIGGTNSRRLVADKLSMLFIPNLGAKSFGDVEILKVKEELPKTSVAGVYLSPTPLQGEPYNEMDMIVQLEDEYQGLTDYERALLLINLWDCFGLEFVDKFIGKQALVETIASLPLYTFFKAGEDDEDGDYHNGIYTSLAAMLKRCEGVAKVLAVHVEINIHDLAEHYSDIQNVTIVPESDICSTEDFKEILDCEARYIITDNPDLMKDIKLPTGETYSAKIEAISYIVQE